ncbi:NAD(P)H-binding protein [Nocardia sp. NPDC051570]|uniref:NAD(P)H-binding protein n=1 Tax=Nocardia sp. NPDC051570 TaxID=3364324 RepID=UPI0037897E40
MTIHAERSTTTLITGSRGGIGAGLVRRLHASGRDVRAASRAPARTTLPRGVRTVALDLADPTTFPAALAGVTDMFLYAEPTGIDALLKVAVDAGARRVVLLSSDSVERPGADNDALARHHLMVEHALRDSPLTTTVLRPGGFATMTLGWAQAIRRGDAVEQLYPDAALDVLHPADIVDVAELALTTGELDGATVPLGGPETLTFKDQADTLAELLGRKVELREPTRARMAEQMSSHIPPAFVDAVLNYWAQLSNDRTGPLRSAERFTGRAGRTFRQWATENLHSFRNVAEGPGRA